MANFAQCSMSKDGIMLNLQKGLEAEHRAHDLCQDFLKLLEDEGDRIIVEKIISDEERHIKITEDLIKIVEGFYLAEYKK